MRRYAQRKTIAVRLNCGIYRKIGVRATMVGKLWAVHPGLYRSDVLRRPQPVGEFWEVTHVPTGIGLGNFALQHVAFRFARKLEAKMAHLSWWARLLLHLPLERAIPTRIMLWIREQRESQL